MQFITPSLYFLSIVALKFLFQKHFYVEKYRTHKSPTLSS